MLHGDTEHHRRAGKEVETESTAFVVCHALGLDTASFALPPQAIGDAGREPTGRAFSLLDESRLERETTLEALEG